MLTGEALPRRILRVNGGSRTEYANPGEHLHPPDRFTLPRTLWRASMDPRIEIWEVLHDGEITAIAGEQTATLTMFVSIPYLRRRVQPLEDSFVLTLTGLTRFEWHDLDGSVSSLRQELEYNITPGIVGTGSESLPVTVETTTGSLVLDFEGIRYNLDTGDEVPYEAIRRGCDDYWREWEKRFADKGDST